MKESLETTICNLCEWINDELEKISSYTTESILPEVIKSLASLVAASKSND